MIDAILRMLRRVWSKIKSFFTRLFLFGIHVTQYFKDIWYRVQMEQNHEDLIAVAIKNNDFATTDIGLGGITNVVYDTKSNEILEQYSQHTECQELDQVTKNQFQGKQVLILK
ncbi:hypothetical protein [Algivirga pacifica]